MPSAPGAVRLEELDVGATSGAPVSLPALGPDAVATLRPYVPRAVVDRLSAAGDASLAEQALSGISGNAPALALE